MAKAEDEDEVVLTLLKMTRKQFKVFMWMIVMLLAAIVTGWITGWISLRWYELVVGIYFIIILVIPYVLWLKK